MIADSSAWIELLRATGSFADRRLKEALQRGERLLMPDVVYQEVLQGARSAVHFVRLQRALDAVPAYRLNDTREAARQAAMLYLRCRLQDITIRSPNDCLIAVCAVEAQEPLLHADRDFTAIARIEPRLRLLS